MANLSSLRLRMIAAFLLVAVPPMLFSAFFAARLLSDAFDTNVQQWLTETANFISAEVDELVGDAKHASNVLADKMHQSSNSSEVFDLGPDVALMSSLGVDVVAVYDEKNRLVYSSIPIDRLTPLPDESTKSLFEVSTNGTSQLAAGAIHAFMNGGKLHRIFVAYWLNDMITSEAKAITSLEFEVFLNEKNKFIPMLPNQKHRPNTPPSADIVNALKNSATPVAGTDGNQSIYRGVYSGLKASNGELLGVVFVGFAKHQSLFEQIGRWHLFMKMFLIGSILSVIAGLWMSGILVRPLRALTRGVRSVSQGDFKQRVPVSGGAEIEELATAFNSMASELERLQNIEVESRNLEKLSTLGEAAVVIAHEVRNPLGIIKTSSELVRSRANLTKEESRVMGYVTEEVNRIEKLIRNFLDFAKPTPPKLEPVKLRDIVDRIAKVVGPEFERRRINFKIEDESISSEVKGDADQIYQVCLNLVLNSMDAMNGNGVINAEIRKTSGSVVLCITDNGPGIPEEMVPKIFDPFFTTKATGTGLGLAKAQSIMSAHGGRLTFSPAEVTGAHFNLIFPQH